MAERLEAGVETSDSGDGRGRARAESVDETGRLAPNHGARVPVTFTLRRVPDGTPPGSAFFVAGTFNEWHPADPAFRLLPGRDGNLATTVWVEPGSIAELKVTRGSWESVEKGPRGQETPNRFVVVPDEGRTVPLAPAAWRDQAPPPPPGPARTGTVEVIHDFPGGQLSAARRIWVYLPPGYQDGASRFPVLYMHDGQNVFETATSFAGEWQVDESLDRLCAEGSTSGLIVVAIDNAGSRRLDEYSPFRDARLDKGGAGDAYLSFLVHAVKPFIDRSFRTRPEAASTGVAGSSMGGLISLYAAYRYPSVFSKVAALSPSVDFAHFALARLARRTPAPQGLHVWLDIGGRESGEPREDRAAVEMVVRFHQLLLDRGFAAARTRLVVDPEGAHNEAAWAKRFPEVVTWLFGT